MVFVLHLNIGHRVGNGEGCKKSLGLLPIEWVVFISARARNEGVSRLGGTEQGASSFMVHGRIYFYFSK